MIITSVTLTAYHTMPLYLLPVSELVGGTIGQAQLLITFCGLASMVASLFLGQLLKKFSARLLVVVAGAALTLFFLSIYVTHNMPLFYVGGVLLGFSIIVGGSGIAMTEINWWFAKDTAKLMSSLIVGVGVATMIASPIVAKAIEAFGARQVALVQGILMGGLVILPAISLLSEHPDHYGIVIHEQAAADGLDNADETSLSLKNILSTPTFWIVMTAIFFGLFALTGFMNNSPAFYQTIGVDAVRSSIGISVFSVAILIWAPVFGFLVDKFGVRVASTICSLPAAVIFAAATMMRGFTSAMVIAALFSSLYFTSLLGPVLYPMIFGKKEAASLIGFANAGASVGGMLGAPVAGFIYDYFGSYNPFLILSSMLCVVTLFCVFLATGKNATEKVRALRGAMKE
jgi:MFS family permease